MSWHCRAPLNCLRRGCSVWYEKKRTMICTEITCERVVRIKGRTVFVDDWMGIESGSGTAGCNYKVMMYGVSQVPESTNPDRQGRPFFSFPAARAAKSRRLQPTSTLDVSTATVPTNSTAYLLYD